MYTKQTMYRWALTTLVVMSCMFTSTGFADFSRYQIILDRRPFGEAPAVETTTPQQAARPAGPSYLDRVRLAGMRQSLGDIRVAIVDENVNPHRSYFIFVGNTEDGLRVVSADYAAETVIVERDGEQRVLRMGGGSQPHNAVRPGMTARGSREASSRDRDGPRRGSPAARMSEARRLREEEAQRRREHVPELTGAALDLYLRKYNMEVIRQGAPPLPIPLTPEEDAQLVAEGVLPPVEE